MPECVMGGESQGGTSDLEYARTVGFPAVLLRTC